MSRSFLWSYLTELAASLPHHYGDENYDAARFGPPKAHGRLGRMVGIDSRQPRLFARTTKFVFKSRPQLEWLYRHLHDAPSRALLVKVFSYRALGHHKVKLPLSTPEYWQMRAAFQQLADPVDTRPAPGRANALPRHRLHARAIPLEVYFSTAGIASIYGVEQYHYRGPDGEICVMPGDYVVDAGGCWGDTALYFAWKTGPTGRVYSWEFVPSNLQLFRENLALNPEYSQRVELVEAPVWSTSGQTLYFSDMGPGSRVSFTASPKTTGQVQTLTIDDMVKQRNLPRVDFIKMDIEGAEMNALRGAEETLRRFRPKLAISVYHNLQDFVDVPAYLDGLGVGYRFYLKHATIYREETVLFADAGRPPGAG